jgi:Lon protease-like protein
MHPFIPPFVDLPPSIPVFPLANAVVLPGAQLPLNIFEPRYLHMVSDALRSDQMIGMVQPEDVHASDGPPAAVGGAGRITAFTETSDGRIILVLTGVCRFRLVESLPTTRGYRRFLVDWRGFQDDYDDFAGIAIQRTDLLDDAESFCAKRSAQLERAGLSRLSDRQFVNCLAGNLPLSAEEKQVLIEAPDLASRAQLLAEILQMAAACERGGSSLRH